MTQVGLCQINTRKENDWNLAGSVQRLDFSDFSPRQAYGITAEYMFTNIWGVGFSVAGGKDYFESSSGPILGLLFILKTVDALTDEDDEDDGVLTIAIIGAIIASFENSNFHIPISRNLELIPNFSLLKYRYMYDENNDYQTNDFLSWSVGLKIGVLTKNNWYYNGFTERAQLYYSGRPWGWQVGVNVGYTFKSKKVKE